MANDEFTLCGQGYYDVLPGPGVENGQPCWFLQYAVDPPVRWARAINYNLAAGYIDGRGWNDLNVVADAGSATTYDSGGAVFCDNDGGALSGIIESGHAVDGINHFDAQLRLDYDTDGYTSAISLAPFAL